MVAVPVVPLSAAPGEQRVLLTSVSWEQYCRLVEIFDQRPALRLTYLHCALEIPPIFVRKGDGGSPSAKANTSTGATADGASFPKASRRSCSTTARS